jgi:hypothetical protein
MRLLRPAPVSRKVLIAILINWPPPPRVWPFFFVKGGAAPHGVRPLPLTTSAACRVGTPCLRRGRTGACRPSPSARWWCGRHRTFRNSSWAAAFGRCRDRCSRLPPKRKRAPAPRRGTGARIHFSVVRVVCVLPSQHRVDSQASPAISPRYSPLLQRHHLACRRCRGAILAPLSH